MLININQCCSQRFFIEQENIDQGGGNQLRKPFKAAFKSIRLYVTTVVSSLRALIRVLTFPRRKVVAEVTGHTIFHTNSIDINFKMMPFFLSLSSFFYDRYTEFSAMMMNQIVIVEKTQIL